MNCVRQNNGGLGYFNMIRGLGLLFIIAGHSIAPFLVNQSPVITGPVFHGAGRVLGGGILAMFFIISGCGFYRRSPQKCLAIQSKLLLKPYALTALALVTCKLILNIFKGKDFLRLALGHALSFLLGLNASRGGKLLGLPVTTISILWFVPALFGGWVLYNLIVHLPHRWRKICVTGCVTLSWILSMISRVWPMVLPMVLLAVGYIAAGHMIASHNLLHRRLPGSVWLILIVTSLISMAFGYVDIAACVWKLGPVDIAGSFCIAFLLLRLYARFMGRGCNGSVFRLLEQIGLNSIWILCLHAFEHAFVPWNQLNGLLPESPALCAILCLLGKSVIIFLLYQLIRHLPRKKRETITIEPEKD